MAERKSFVDKKKVGKLNKDVWNRGRVDREHLMEFLTLIDNNDAQVIIKAVKSWLKDLHDDPKYDKVRFPDGDIDAIIGDLDSYGRLQPETIMQFKESSNKTLPIS
jgi:hypothetical protein